MPKVDKQMIEERKIMYGNNFPRVAQLWNHYVKEKNIVLKFTPQDVANLLGLMKVVRCGMSPEHKDSYIDMNNYFWIADNYEEYCALGEKKDEK